MDSIKVGFAFCGSFCTYAKALETLERVKARYGDVTPIVSPSGVDIDTRFGNAHDHLREMERICDRRVIDSIAKAEPIGPKGLLDVLVICPCTGNTLGKLAGGITDTAVTMAAKSHLRNQRPVVIAMASNDGLSGAARNIGELLVRKGYYFVPFGQDDPERKPCSLMADFSLIGETVQAALEGRQIQPILRTYRQIA